MVQALPAPPVSDSASVEIALGDIALPTARQDATLTQATPPTALWLSMLPAATHDFGPVQDTDCKVASRPSGGSGAGTSAQTAPFHSSAIGTL